MVAVWAYGGFHMWGVLGEQEFGWLPPETIVEFSLYGSIVLSMIRETLITMLGLP